MFVSKDIVYLQMQKTGSTHATRLLQRYCGGYVEQKHSQLKQCERFRSSLIVSSIRNPWDWYVSLWAFGCMGKGGLRNYLGRLPLSEFTEARRRADLATIMKFPFRLVLWPGQRREWIALYSDASNAANFRSWLKLVLGREGQRIGKNGYASSPINAAVGFMTYRFLALTTEYQCWMAEGRKCRTYSEVLAFADRRTITDRILRMESLNNDLASLLNSAGIPLSPKDVAEWGRHNSSDHQQTFEYYDAETRDLVARRERFIVDRFGYKMP